MTREDFNKIKKEFLFEQLHEENVNLFDDNQLNDDAIKKAIKKAYEDSQPRLIVGHSQLGNNILDWEAIKYLKERIEVFLKGEVENFDDWHETTSGTFLKKYNELLKTIKDVNNETQQRGKAQKIINMTLKYLYCMQEDDDNIFKDCHMTIDSYTLEWFFRVANYKEEDGKVVKCCTKKEVGCWSKMSDKKYENIVKRIRTYLEEEQHQYYIDEKNKMTPLQAEFIIWEEEKIRAALLALTDEKRNNYDKENLSSLINIVEDRINKIKTSYGILN